MEFQAGAFSVQLSSRVERASPRVISCPEDREDRIGLADLWPWGSQPEGRICLHSQYGHLSPDSNQLPGEPASDRRHAHHESSAEGAGLGSCKCASPSPGTWSRDGWSLVCLILICPHEFLFLHFFFSFSLFLAGLNPVFRFVEAAFRLAGRSSRELPIGFLHFCHSHLHTQHVRSNNFSSYLPWPVFVVPDIQ